MRGPGGPLRVQDAELGRSLVLSSMGLLVFLCEQEMFPFMNRRSAVSADSPFHCSKLCCFSHCFKGFFNP